MRDEHGREFIDIGHQHGIMYTSWAPHDLEPNRERYGVPLPNIAKAGLIIRHPNRGKPTEKFREWARTHPPGPWCEGAVHFDLPELRKGFPKGPFWKVISWEPLTLTPSFLCLLCGDHGFIKKGQWEVAG